MSVLSGWGLLEDGYASWSQWGMFPTSDWRVVRSGKETEHDQRTN
jgi:hypothetical protein